MAFGVNRAPVNAGAVGFVQLGLVVDLGGSAAVEVTANQPDLQRQRRLAGSGTIALAGSAEINRIRSVAGAITLAFDAEASLKRTARLSGLANIGIGGTLFAFQDVLLGGTATITLDGFGFLGDIVLGTDPATISVTASGELAKVKPLRGDATITLDGSLGDPDITAELRGSTTIAFEAVALPRVDNGVTVISDLGGKPATIQVAASGALDVDALMAGSASIAVTAAGQMKRVVRPRANPAFISVFGVLRRPAVSKSLGPASATVALSSVASLRRDARAAGSATVNFTTSTPRVSARRPLQAEAAIDVSANDPAPIRRAGLAGTTVIDLAAAAVLDTAEKLFGSATIEIIAQNTDVRIAERLGGVASVAVAGSGRIVRQAALAASADVVLSGGAALLANPQQSTVEGRIIIHLPEQRSVEHGPADRAIPFAGDDFGGGSVETREKQPPEVVDYIVEMDEWFEDIPSDDIETVTVEITPTGDPDDLVAGPGALPETQKLGDPARNVRVWLGGGRDGVTYKVELTVTTEFGRVEQPVFRVKVRDQ